MYRLMAVIRILAINNAIEYDMIHWVIFDETVDPPDGRPDSTAYIATKVSGSEPDKVASYNICPLAFDLAVFFFCYSGRR